MDLPLPLALRALSDEVDDRLARIPTPLNEYGFDPFGASLTFARRDGTVAAFLYRHYFRVETHGIEKVPEGRVLLIANHAGNTLPMDGAMLVGRAPARRRAAALRARDGRVLPAAHPLVERDDPPRRRGGRHARELRAPARARGGDHGLPRGLARVHQAVQPALQAAALRHRLRAAGAADQDADRAGRDRRLRGAEPGAASTPRASRARSARPRSR